ncbi:ABC transporter permease [Serinicoccus kebangsaanensis]|uniref:ABC transporter permease n=1 Tax=Serinicoccus kebangsaanensis TaxID=2602069 RepID=UPI00178C2D1C|nr:ABC transporter permease [Serinicoccus kebangsaanensis]
MRSVLAIAWVELKRFLADRSNIFFVFIFPLALVAVIGWQFGGGGPGARVSVVAPEGEARTALVQSWEDAVLAVTVRDSAEQLRDDVARGDAQVGVVLSDDAARAFEDGERMEVQIIQGTGSQAPAVAQAVRSQTEAVASEARQVGALAGLADPATARDALSDASSAVPGPRLLVQEPEDPLAEEFSGAGQFDVGASGQLLLFIFMSALTASVAIIQARRDGVIRRTVAAPVTTGQTMVGLTLGRLVIALFQGVYIMVASAVLFGVEWGNLWVTMVVVLTFALVASGAALLVGVLVDNEGAASGLSVGLGLVLAALGGSMLPLELFPDRLRTVAHLTPHAWGYDALADIQRRDAGLLDVLPEVGALLAMAVVVLTLGSLALRRSLSRAM